MRYIYTSQSYGLSVDFIFNECRCTWSQQRPEIDWTLVQIKLRKFLLWKPIIKIGRILLKKIFAAQTTQNFLVYSVEPLLIFQKMIKTIRNPDIRNAHINWTVVFVMDLLYLLLLIGNSCWGPFTNYISTQGGRRSAKC